MANLRMTTGRNPSVSLPNIHHKIVISEITPKEAPNMLRQHRGTQSERFPRPALSHDLNSRVGHLHKDFKMGIRAKILPDTGTALPTLASHMPWIAIRCNLVGNTVTCNIGITICLTLGHTQAGWSRCICVDLHCTMPIVGSVARVRDVSVKLQQR